MLSVLFDPGWANRVGLAPGGTVLQGLCGPAYFGYMVSAGDRPCCYVGTL